MILKLYFLIFQVLQLLRFKSIKNFLWTCSIFASNLSNFYPQHCKSITIFFHFRYTMWLQTIHKEYSTDIVQILSYWKMGIWRWIIENCWNAKNPNGRGRSSVDRNWRIKIRPAISINTNVQRFIFVVVTICPGSLESSWKIWLILFLRVKGKKACEAFISVCNYRIFLQITIQI